MVLNLHAGGCCLFLKNDNWLAGMGDGIGFEKHENKLERNVYGSLKGRIRTFLLERDISEYCQGFTSSALRILDIGGGVGHFARICMDRGHHVVLLDNNRKMLDQARMLRSNDNTGRLEIVEQDFLAEQGSPGEHFDLVLMHGSAEWMSLPESAIRKACSMVKSGGLLSLLIFNSDKNMLKQGINGGLVSGNMRSRKKKLTPPGARSPVQVEEILNDVGGTTRLVSGIRIFYGFFRQNDTSVLTPDEWVEQERRYYRTPPFNHLGEHTHFIWEQSSCI